MSKTRFNWDVFPSTKLEAKNMVSPIGCMFTPFDSIVKEVSESYPLECSSCQAIINQFIQLNRSNGEWWCPFCQNTTVLPESFIVPSKGCADEEISVPIRPSSHGTVDYILPEDISQAKLKGKFVVYVIDTYKYFNQNETSSDGVDEFMTLKEAIANSIKKLPEDCEIIIVTFSDTVVLHKPSLGAVEVIRTHDRVEEDQDAPSTKPNRDIDFYLDQLKDIVEKLSKPDICSKPNPELLKYVLSLSPHYTSSLKPPRATGLSVMASCQLISNFFSNLYLGKVSLFLTGAGTLEPGKIVDERGTLRSHKDILNSSAPYVTHTQRFYKIFAFLSAGYTLQASIKCANSLESPLLFSIAREATKFTFDIYSGFVNQVGIYEMKVLAQAGNGNIFMSESFASLRFAATLTNNLLLFVEGNSNCILTVVPSSGLKVSSLVANCTPLQSSYQLERHLHLHNEKISDVITKYDSALKQKHFTNRWFAGCLNKADTFSIFFEVETVSSSTKLDMKKGRQEILVQFQVTFYDSKIKRNVMRVTTVRRPTTLAVITQPELKGRAMSRSPQSQVVRNLKISESFNAHEWIILLTRLLIDKIDALGGFDSIEEILDQTNRAIIRLLYNFSGIEVFQKADANPYENLTLQYSIKENFKELLPYAYNLSRNPHLIKVFNSSPDETAFYHHLFRTLDRKESSTLLKPALYISRSGYLEEVPLSWKSLKNETNVSQYFVMDSLNQIIVYKSIAKPEDCLKLHPSNNEILLSAATLSEELKPIILMIKTQIVSTRKIVPNIILTQTGHSQARFLQARLEAQPRAPPQKTKRTTKWWHFGSSKGRTSKKLTDEMLTDEFYELLVKKVEAIRLDSL